MYTRMLRRYFKHIESLTKETIYELLFFCSFQWTKKRHLIRHLPIVWSNWKLGPSPTSSCWVEKWSNAPMKWPASATTRSQRAMKTIPRPAPKKLMTIDRIILKFLAAKAIRVRRHELCITFWKMWFHVIYDRDVRMRFECNKIFCIEKLCIFHHNQWYTFRSWYFVVNNADTFTVIAECRVTHNQLK